MPAVSERFKSYHDFASASLEDIYGARLEDALQLRATHLESGVWLNDRKQAFRWQSFPWDCQLSPVNDVAGGDFDSDGFFELILAHNHDTNWIETGQWRGTPGSHIEWTGKSFETIPFVSSGILLPKDTKSILAVKSKGEQTSIVAGQNNDALLLFFRNLVE